MGNMLPDFNSYISNSFVAKKAQLLSSVDPMYEAAVQTLQDGFSELLRNDDALRTLLSKLRHNSSLIVIFGGWVRDKLIDLMHSQPVKSADLDIVVHGDTPLQQIVPVLSTRNLFGGYILKTSTTHIDIWELGNTYSIAKKRLKIDFKTLPSTTVFRMNSIVFYPQEYYSEPTLCDGGAVSAINDKIVDFSSSEVPVPLIQVVRALIYGTKLGFSLAPEVTDFVSDYCSDSDTVGMIRQNLVAVCPDAHLQEANTLLNKLIKKK
jgi:hypothetical protein